MSNPFFWLIGSDQDEETIFCHGKNNFLPGTLKETKLKIHQISENIQQQKVETIAIYCDDIFYFYITFYACILSHKNIILLPNNTPGLREDLQHDYDALINFDSDTEMLYFNNHPVLFNREQTANCLSKNNSLKNDFLELKIIFFSSGSTGKPKKIIKQFKHLIQEVDTLDHLFSPVLKNEMVVSSVHHQHLYGFTFAFLWPSLYLRRIYTSRINLSEEIEYISKKIPSFIFVSSPAFLSRLTFKHDLSQLKCFSAGSLLEKTIAQKLMYTFKLHVTEIFGSSETGIIAWRSQLENKYWQSFDKVYVTQNKEKKLCVKTDFFPENSIETGDLIHLVDRDQFILLGRADRIVKIEGKRLSLTEMENKLKTHSWVHDCYVLKLHHVRDYVGVFIVLSNRGVQYQAQLKIFTFNQQLRQFLSHWFEKIVLPKAFRYGKEIPLNSQSKINQSSIGSLFKSF